LQKLCEGYQLAPDALQQLEDMLQKAYAERPNATAAAASEPSDE
jgi:hypothetical protein